MPFRARRSEKNALMGESAPRGRLYSGSLGIQPTAKGRMSAKKGKKKDAPGGRLHSGSLGTQLTAKGRMTAT